MPQDDADVVEVITPAASGRQKVVNLLTNHPLAASGLASVCTFGLAVIPYSLQFTNTGWFAQSAF